MRHSILYKKYSSAETLVISFVGMKQQEVSVKPHVIVVLHPDAEVLDEVMVVAYGTAKKSSFTGSASNIDNKKLELRPITNVSKGLEGQTTGLLTTSGSGQPGESSKIVIRGYGSINASQNPLYVVDGIPYDGDLSSINPADIESMTVLKDASAGALYGARGANGVVMINTKRGKEGKTSVTWRSTVGWSSRAIPEYDMVNQKDFVQLTYEALRNGYVFTSGYNWADAESQARADLSSTLGGELYNPFKNYTWDNIIDPATGQVRADATSAWNERWMDALLNNNAFRHEHQLGLNGGTEKTKYMFSLGYLNEDGILTTTGFQRYNARANVNSQVTDWFNAFVNTSLSHSVQNYSDYTGASTSNVWYSSQFVSPLFPLYVKDAEGNNVLDENGNPQLDYGENGRPGSYNDYNPLGGLVDDKAEIKNDVASMRTGLTFGSDKDSYGVLKGLKFAVNFGLDYRSQSSMSYMNMYHGPGTATSVCTDLMSCWDMNFMHTNMNICKQERPTLLMEFWNFARVQHWMQPILSPTTTALNHGWDVSTMILMKNIISLLPYVVMDLHVSIRTTAGEPSGQSEVTGVSLKKHSFRM